MRLDLFLVKKYPDYSRSFLQNYVHTFGVFVNKVLIKKSHFEIGENDSIKLPSSLKSTVKVVDKKKLSPAFLKVENLFKAKSFIVISKPPYITTEDISAGMFPVHRLDKDTSGVLVIAKNIISQVKLQKQWQKRTVKKTYIALIKGILPTKEGRIEAPIARSRHDRKKMAVSARSVGRDAQTEYRVVKVFPKEGVSLIDAFPKTGRTHQIRVHFTSIGNPIVGDSIYGDSKLNKKFEQKYGLKRQFLHAHKLSLQNLTTKKRQTFTAKLAPDLTKVLEKLGKSD